MLTKLLINPFFWISIYLIGYITAMVVFISSRGLSKAENKIPRTFIRIFTLSTFVGPAIVLPFTEGPKIDIPTPITLTLGIILLGINFYLKIMAQKRIGVIPALKGKSKIITTGIYGVIRHPLYISNSLLALGMAILFKSMFAFLFSILYFFLYLPMIYFEEKDLLKKYGEEYQEYKRKVPWRIIPKIF